MIPWPSGSQDRDFAGEGVDVEKGEHQFADEEAPPDRRKFPSRDGEKDERQGEKHGNRMVDEDGSRFSNPFKILPMVVER